MIKILTLVAFLALPNVYAAKIECDSCSKPVFSESIFYISKNFSKILHVGDKTGVISKFRLNGLSQLKYHSDALLCEDIKFGLEFSAENKVQIDDLNTGLRLIKIGEMFEELLKFPEQDALIKECQEKHF